MSEFVARLRRLALPLFACSLLAGVPRCRPTGQQPGTSVANLFRAAQQEASAGRYEQTYSGPWRDLTFPKRFNLPTSTNFPGVVASGGEADGTRG